MEFVNLVNILEKGLKDLEIIGHAEEISNSHPVQIIERKLSTQILRKCVVKDFELRELNGSNIRDGKT